MRLIPRLRGSALFSGLLVGVLACLGVPLERTASAAPGLMETYYVDVPLGDTTSFDENAWGPLLASAWGLTPTDPADYAMVTVDLEGSQTVTLVETATGDTVDTGDFVEGSRYALDLGSVLNDELAREGSVVSAAMYLCGGVLQTGNGDSYVVLLRIDFSREESSLLAPPGENEASFLGICAVADTALEADSVAKNDADAMNGEGGPGPQVNNDQSTCKALADYNFAQCLAGHLSTHNGCVAGAMLLALGATAICVGIGMANVILGVLCCIAALLTFASTLVGCATALNTGRIACTAAYVTDLVGCGYELVYP
jgi:hypothetical protein